MIPGFVAAHGRSPNSRGMLRLRQRATLATRPDKHVHPLAEQVEGWRKRAHVFAEVLRQIHGVRFASADDRMAVVERIVGLALDEVLLISAPELAQAPARFTRPDGTSQFRARGFEVYTTQALLDAETRLLDAGRCTQSPRVAIRTVADVAAENLPGRAHPLSADQACAVEQIATSGRVLDVLVGPAGTGKSTTMGGLRAVWERQFGPGSVVGLAPSAAAAQVLAEEFGVATENTSKWLTEHARQPDRLREIDSLRTRLNRAGPSMSTSMLRKRIDNLSTEVDKWSLRSGQIVVVDEASLAGTFALDTLTEQARNAGAKVVLVGDWAQLSPVEAGGAFHLFVHDRDLAPELADVRRFNHAWEKTASIDLRVGRPEAVDVYEAHGRIVGGDRDSMLDRLYDAWRADVAAGHRSLMIASDNDTVAALNERARAHRVAVGEVPAHGIQVVSGAVVGVGDVVVTRENNRLLSCGRGWVKNGDQWLVEEVAADGAVTVARTRGAGMPGGRQVVLPAGYVRQHVELGYALTAHRAQGRTVDTAHAFVSVTTQREVLYVAATRGRESNRLYVDTRYDPDADTQHGLPAERDSGDVLRQVLEARGADLSATETIAAAWAEQHGIVRMWAEYDTIAGVAQRARYDELVTSSCSAVASEQVEGLRDSAAYGPLLAALREAEALGLDVELGLPRLVNGRTLSSADDVAAVLHGRVDRWIQVESGVRRRLPRCREGACSGTDHRSVA